MLPLYIAEKIPSRTSFERSKEGKFKRMTHWTLLSILFFKSEGVNSPSLPGSPAEGILRIKNPSSLCLQTAAPSKLKGHMENEWIPATLLVALCLLLLLCFLLTMRMLTKRGIASLQRALKPRAPPCSLCVYI